MTAIEKIQQLAEKDCREWPEDVMSQIDEIATAAACEVAEVLESYIGEEVSDEADLNELVWAGREMNRAVLERHHSAGRE